MSRHPHPDAAEYPMFTPGQRVRTIYGEIGYVAVVTHGGLRVHVTAAPDGGRLIGEFHPAKVWPWR